MADKYDLMISVTLPFPQAGIAFAIEVASAGGGAAEPPSFVLRAKRIDTGETVPFRSEASPHLADWARGYSRWLRRANVDASLGEDGMTGSFSDGLTTQQVLRGVSDACDMIHQRFDLYRSSILG